MSTAMLRRHRFGGLFLPVRTIVILERNGVTPQRLRTMTLDQLHVLGLDQIESINALRAAQQKAIS